MPNDINSILDLIPAHREALRPLREILLTNAMMLGELPAPTFGEQKRVAFLGNRFIEAGLQIYPLMKFPAIVWR